MKKIKNILIIVLILMGISNICFGHGGNITGWKNKDSELIINYNGKYYGYHKENGVEHYHQVKWDEEKQRWAIVAPAVYYDEKLEKIEKNYSINVEKIEVELNSIVDGDTAKFKMNGEQIIVRFLGIDTRETVDPVKGEEPYGKEASEFTKQKLENASKIELEFDELADKKDKYERYLAWIWIDDELLQDLLIKSGLAETYMLQNNYKYAGILQESEELAKENKLGIWSDKISGIKSNENEDENIITYNNTVNENKYEFLYKIIGIVIILYVSITSITQSKNKRKKKN